MKNCRFDFGTESGIHVDPNYDGDISVSNSVFVGKKGKAIVNVLDNLSGEKKAIARQMFGTSTKPVAEYEIQHFTSSKNAPSIETLRSTAVSSSSISSPAS